jgi:hypothetical protein
MKFYICRCVCIVIYYIILLVEKRLNFFQNYLSLLSLFYKDGCAYGIMSICVSSHHEKWQIFMKLGTVFWDLMPYSLGEIIWHFRGAYCLHHKGDFYETRWPEDRHVHSCHCENLKFHENLSGHHGTRDYLSFPASINTNTDSMWTCVVGMIQASINIGPEILCSNRSLQIVQLLLTPLWGVCVEFVKHHHGHVEFAFRIWFVSNR